MSIWAVVFASLYVLGAGVSVAAFASIVSEHAERPTAHIRDFLTSRAEQ